VVSRRKIKFKQSYTSLSLAIKDKSFDYIIVASKTNEHRSDLLEILSLGYNNSILIEKPLFDKPYDISFDSTNNIFVGYNLRFIPLFEKLQKIISREKILSVIAYAGSYLPDWRPNSDYRQSYSAKKNEGGGVLRDLSHELDYLVYLLGAWESVTSLGGNFSQLEIDSDDIYSIMMKMNRCPVVSVHFHHYRVNIIRINL
jgi:predicted dehydrogenase